MNMKENKGFTLVELIVVIAILGILAAVAVPAYTGYITKAHDASVITKLDALNTAVGAANATDKAISVSSVNADGVTVTLSDTPSAASFISDFNLYYNTTGATVSDKTLKLPSEAKIDFANTSFATSGATRDANGWK